MTDQKTPDPNAAEPAADVPPEGDVEPQADASAEAGTDAGGKTATVEDELRAEIAELKDQLLRALAETENVRRRAEREKADTTKYAIANFARAVLPFADNLRRALDSVGAEARRENEAMETLCVGLEMTEAELANTFTQFGIKPVEALGKKFDPNYHQAMFEVEDPSQPQGTVVQVMQTGYLLQDRLLRPAMVGISKGGPKESGSAEGAPSEAVASGEAGGTDGTAADDATGDSASVRRSQAYSKRADAAGGGTRFDTEL